jgi:hypothetical protein
LKSCIELAPDGEADLMTIVVADAAIFEAGAVR